MFGQEEREKQGNALPRDVHSDVTLSNFHSGGYRHS